VVERQEFAATLDRLVPDGRCGLAVSGGPDSLALLLLAAAARPGQVEAASVDHGLRPDSASEAAMVAEVCRGLGVPHAVLAVHVAEGSSLQAQAREARYAALGRWARERGLAAVATAHHVDDQAETLLLRLARGSGVAGLAGVREQRLLRQGVALVRPLLAWRKAELVSLVEAAGLRAVDDPANRDPRHDRSRIRALLEGGDRLDPVRLTRSAAALAEAEAALAWSAERLGAERLRPDGEGLALEAGDLPAEYQRRLLRDGLARLGTLNSRGPDVTHALEVLRRGGRCTLGGVTLAGGPVWRLAPAPPRRA
jgi:tRNA(Ile)-lysidine synthase